MFFSRARRLDRTTARASCGPRRWPSGRCAAEPRRDTMFAPLDRLRPRRPLLTLLERMALLPAGARSPAAAGALPADLGRGRRRLRARGARSHGPRPAGALELAGPQTLTYERDRRRSRCAAGGRPRPRCTCPPPLVRAVLRSLEGVAPGARPRRGTRPSCWRCRWSRRPARAGTRSLGVEPGRCGTSCTPLERFSLPLDE